MPLWAAFLVVFVSSACTMVLELIAGRILAPYIGVSLYTWTSIIGVCLAGISFGNYLGGQIADRWPSRGTLGVLLAASAVASLAILPLINIATAIPTGQLIDAADRLGGNLQIDRAAILIARIVAITTVIFLTPVLIMGMVSPVVIRLTLRDVAHSGGLVGKIYAISTLGAIVGTFATGFVLVQVFGTRLIVVGVGVTLVAMALGFGDLLRVRRRAAAALAAGLLLVGMLIPARAMAANGCLDRGFAPDCLGKSFQTGLEQALHSGCLRETNYFCIKVYDHIVSSEQLVKTLVLDHLVHSYNSVEDPNYLQYGYIKVYAELANYLASRLPNQDIRVLNIGGGGYTHPRHVEATYPNATQEVIEIDPGVTQTVYEKLGLDRDKTRIVTYNVDGRQALNELVREKPGSYDMIIGDAFNDLSVPYHLTTREFDLLVKQLLKDDGYYATLVIDKLKGGKFITAYTETARSVWPHVYVTADGNPWESQYASTYVVVAGNQPLDLEALKRVRGQGPEGRPVTGVMPLDEMEAWLAEARAPILTDDYAPVDNLIAPIFAERGF